MAKADRPIELIGRGLAGLLSAALEATPAWAAHVRQQTANHALLVHLKEDLMALTQKEQAAVNDLSAAVDTLATDLNQANEAARSVKADMQAQIDGLTAGQAVDAQTIAALQASVDQMETDVIGALSPLTARVSEIDQGLKTPPAQGGSPLTPGA